VSGKNEISIIIPTTGDGKPLLEQCLAALYTHCADLHPELIIIDNASIDDTADYLQQLEHDRFLDCIVIQNHQNRGFASALKQGLDQASGTYIAVMHNDVILQSDALGALKDALQLHPEFGLIGASADQCFNEAQRWQEQPLPGIHECDFVDSFLMMFRKESGFTPDPDYEMAYFEDRDLSMQCKADGFKTGFMPAVKVKHEYAVTCRVLALDPESDVFWKNAAHFDKKWRRHPLITEQLTSLPFATQLIRIEERINPRYPQLEFVDYLREIFTKEELTRLFAAELSPEMLAIITRLMMILDDRPLLRRFEDKLIQYAVPIYLARELVEYYFSRNIYSRAQLYVDSVPDQYRTLPFRLVEIQLLVENRDLQSAVELLQVLIRQYPYHPELLHLSGELHRLSGNESEARNFFRLAEMVCPTRYNSDDSVFEI
jgi:glycosyltransferase involved in cell wall biosynthesis